MPPPVSTGGGGITEGGGGGAGAAWSTTGRTHPGLPDAACATAAPAVATAAVAPHSAAWDACVPKTLSVAHGLIWLAVRTVEAALAAVELNRSDPASNATVKGFGVEPDIDVS